MKIVWKYPGWGWRMYGLLNTTKHPYWFFGFSKTIGREPK
jgi:hypothetical protein